MKVKFNWQDPDRLFMGVRKLQLHAMNADPSLLRERLAYSLYRDMGVESCRTAHARVLINGEFVGLFLLVEQIDGRFTRAHFPEEGGKGNLYKEAWPVHRDPQYYLDRLRTNEEDDPSVDKMVLLADEIAETEEDNLPAVLERWFEIEYTMRQVVVEWAIGRDDGVYNWLCFSRIDTACYNHNFYLYEEEENNRLWLIPWDLDLSFKGSNGFVGPVIDQWDDVSPECVVVPISTGMGPIGLSGLPPNCDPILRGLTHFQADYAALMKELLDGPFSETSVTAKLDTWQEQIRPYVEEASAVHGADELSVSDWEVAVSDLRKTIDSLRTKHASDIN
jgi:hypothetical protein